MVFHRRWVESRAEFIPQRHILNAQSPRTVQVEAARALLLWSQCLIWLLIAFRCGITFIIKGRLARLVSTGSVIGLVHGASDNSEDQSLRHLGTA
jgi:hypothetical protein